MNIYAAANELDLMNFVGAAPSRKPGTYDQTLTRSSIKLPAGSAATASLDELPATTGDLGFHFALASVADGSASDAPFLSGEDVTNNQQSFLVTWRADGTLSITLNTLVSAVFTAGTPVVSTQTLRYDGLSTFDIFITYNDVADETTLTLYKAGLLVNTVTETGAPIYPTRLQFQAPTQASAYISQVVAADELTRNLRLFSLFPVDNGTYTDWTGDRDNVDDVAPNDSDPLTALETDLAESFTVSDGAGDPYFHYVGALHHFETLADSSYSKNNLLLVGDAALSATGPKFGTNCLLLPNTSLSYGYLLGNEELTFDDADFCLELEVSFDAISTDQSLLAQGDGSGAFWRLRKLADNTVVFQASDVADSNPIAVQLTSTVMLSTAGQYYHVRAARRASDWGLFVNGTLEDTAVWNGSLDTAGENLYFGVSGDLDEQLVGKIDEVRITYGAGRDTASFTAPVAQHPDKQLMETTALEAFGEIVGLTVNARCRRADFGDIKLFARRNGTDVISDPLEADVVWSGKSWFFPTDPITSLAWAPTDIPSIEIGVIAGDMPVVVEPVNYLFYMPLQDDFSDQSGNGARVELPSGGTLPVIEVGAGWDGNNCGKGVSNQLDYDEYYHPIFILNSADVPGETTANQAHGRRGPVEIGTYLKFDNETEVELSFVNYFTDYSEVYVKYKFSLFVNDDGSITVGSFPDYDAFGADGPPETYSSSTGLVTTGQWYKFKWVIDGMNMKVYLDDANVIDQNFVILPLNDSLKEFSLHNDIPNSTAVIYFQDVYVDQVHDSAPEDLYYLPFTADLLNHSIYTLPALDVSGSPQIVAGGGPDGAGCARFNQAGNIDNITTEDPFYSTYAMQLATGVNYCGVEVSFKFYSEDQYGAPLELSMSYPYTLVINSAGALIVEQTGRPSVVSADGVIQPQTWYDIRVVAMPGLNLGDPEGVYLYVNDAVVAQRTELVDPVDAATFSIRGGFPEAANGALLQHFRYKVLYYTQFTFPAGP